MSADQPACAAWASCAAGSYVSKPGSGIADRGCASCGAHASFAPPVGYRVGVAPISVAIVDLNADSILDLATANAANANVSVLLGNGNGTFQPKLDFVVLEPSPWAVVAADLNADGKPDLVTANYDFSVSILLGNGNGTFQSAVKYPAGYTPIAVAVGDLNGDAKPDLAVPNSLNDAVLVMLGNGDGTFQAGIEYDASSSTGEGPYNVVIGDVNGDGKPDLIGANKVAQSISVLLGNGNGTFQTGIRYPAGDHPRGLALGDLNGDGKLDLVTHQGVVLIGAGNGSFQAGISIPGGERTAVLRDLNADGHLDFVTENRVVLGNGDGTFQPATDIIAGGGWRSVSVGDLDGDGRPDLVAGNSDRTVNVHLASGSFTVSANQSSCAAWATCNAGTSVSTPGTTTSDRTCGACGSGTFTSNVNQASCAAWLTCPTGDYVSTPGTPTRNRSCSSCTGFAAFTPAVEYPVAVYPMSVAVGDLNSDGKVDLIAAHNAAGNDNLSINFGNGDGTFQAAVNIAIGADPNFVVLADLNADGKLDVVTANYPAATVSVLLANGNGTFQAAVHYAAGLYLLSVAVGDVNADGKPDLVIPSVNPASILVRLGNGDGTFQAANSYSAGIFGGASTTLVPYDVVIGDVNSDGKPDLVTANTYSNTFSVMGGNGTGAFQAWAYDVAGGKPQSLALGDLNGDGKLDVVTDQASVFIGSGYTTFESVVNDGAGEYSVVIQDMNGDGNPDLVLANGASVSVLLGNGNGTFKAMVSHTAGVGVSRSVKVADFNGDGRPDIVAASPSGFSSLAVLIAASGSFTSSPNQAACTPWLTCSATTYVTNSPSTTTNRICAACPAGTCTSSANQNSCQPAATCP